MSRSWRKLAGPTLLVLALVGTVVPALSVLAARSELCAEMKSGAGPEPAHAPCQWLTPASCCQDVGGAMPPPAFAPPAVSDWLDAARLAPLHGLRAPAPHEAPRGDRLALSTVVLRL